MRAIRANDAGPGVSNDQRPDGRRAAHATDRTVIDGWLDGKRDAEQIVDELYWRSLSRRPAMPSEPA